MKTGMIGLGAMGAPMARNLHKGGHLVTVWNRTRSKAEAVAADTGVPVAEDPAALARRSEAIILNVAADADVLAVVDALLPGLQPGTVVVDTSTISADTARSAARRIEAAGGHFLDAPISGGVEGAIQGKLAMMVGGDEAVLARVRPVLDAMAARVVHMGPVGHGQATKAVNQIMAAGINQAVSEALAFGEAMGLPMDRVIEVVGSGAVSNWFLTHRGPNMVRGTFEPGFKMALHRKDLRICRDMAAKAGAELPLVERTLADYEPLIEAGHGEEDMSALFRGKQGLFRR